MPFALPLIDWKPIFELRARFERRVDRDFSRTNLDTATTCSAVSVRERASRGARSRGNSCTNTPTTRTGLRAATSRSGAATCCSPSPRPRSAPAPSWRVANAFSSAARGCSEPPTGNNVSNAWDGARYALGRFDVFAVKTGLLSLPNDEVRLVGAALGPAATPSLLVYKHDERTEKVDEITLSQLYRGKAGPATLDAEIAGQAGHRAGRRKLAGAIDVVASVPVAPKFTLGGQGSVASGGGDGDTNRTFDQLYPSSHDKHGLSDMTGWKNVRDLGLWLRYDPDKRTNFKLQFHGLGLDSATDAWYNANGRPNGRPGGQFIDPTGTHGRDLGHEIDLDFGRTIDPRQTVRAGLALFRPGHFVRDFGGAATKDQVGGYVQYAYRF